MLNRDLAKTICGISIVLVAVIAALGQTPQAHIQQDEGWKNRPVTPADIERRIEAAASQYQQYAPIARITFHDIAYPADANEYAKLDGNAVLVVTTLCQDQSELPLKRVFVVADGKEHELKLVTQVLSKQPSSNEAVAKTFGVFRADAIYLLPVFLTVQKAALVADFAEHRAGFRLAEFLPDSVPPSVTSLPIKPPSGVGPSEPALILVLQREYRGFIQTK